MTDRPLPEQPTEEDEAIQWAIRDIGTHTDTGYVLDALYRRMVKAEDALLNPFGGYVSLMRFVHDNGIDICNLQHDSMEVRRQLATLESRLRSTSLPEASIQTVIREIGKSGSVMTNSDLMKALDKILHAAQEPAPPLRITTEMIETVTGQVGLRLRQGEPLRDAVEAGLAAAFAKQGR